MVNQHKNEVDLLNMSVNGDCAAFELVVTKYQSLVCAITYNATGSVEKSEELAQETFVRAWENLTALKDLAKFKAWLCSIARSTVQAYFRSSRRDPLKNSSPIDSISNTPSDQPGPIDTVISREQQNLVDRALKQLPEEYRQPLILFYRSEQSTKAVASALDLSEDAVRQRLHRGRKMLKDELTSVVETTLARTAPGKTFTTAVMASVAAITAKSAATAAAATVAVTSTASTTATATILSTVTAKIITAAAVIAIATGAAITYKNIKADSPAHNTNTPVVASIDNQPIQTTDQSETDNQNTTETTETIPNQSLTQNIPQTNPTTTPADTAATPEQTNTANTTSTEPAPIPTGETFQVKVIDKQTSLPIANARVRTYPTYKPNHYTTDKTGTCTIDLGKTRPTNLNLFADNEDYTPMSISFNPSTITVIPKDFTFELTKGTPITGHVQKLSDGKPVEGATVKVGHSPHDVTHTEPKFDLRNCTHITDKDGNFKCDKTPKNLENLSISVTHPDFAEKRIWYNNLGKDQVVKRNIYALITPGYNIAGNVRNEQGNPIKDASVFLGEWRSFSGDEVIKTDNKGYFEFLHRTPLNNHAVVSIQKKGYAPELLNMDMAPEMQPAQIVLAPAKSIALRVIDTDGNPINKAKINLGKWRDNQSIKFLGTVDPDRFKYTDSDGRFKWTNAPTDDIEIVIGKTGYMYFSSTPLTPSDEEYEIVLYRPITIAGSVIDAETKESIKNFKLIPGIESFDRPGSLTYQSSVGWLKTCTDGKYSYDFTSPRLSYGIKIVADGYLPAFSEKFYNDQEKISLDFELQKGTGPTGIVITQDGTPVKDAEVCLAKGFTRIENGEIYNKRDQIVLNTKADGKFSFPAQTAELPIIATADAGFAHVTAEEFAQTNEIVLKPWARVTGDFYIGTKPAKDKLLRLSSRPYGEDNAVTDKDGKFTFEKVIPGKISLYRQSYDVQPGQTLELNLGGNGRTVIGKITGPGGQPVFGNKYFSNISIRSLSNPIPADFFPWPDNFDDMTFSQIKKWAAQFYKTPQAQQLMAELEKYQVTSKRYNMSYGGLFAQRPFTVENVPAGRYVFRGHIRTKNAEHIPDFNTCIASLYYEFEVPEFTEDTDLDEPFDIGLIEMKQGKLDIDSYAPDFTIPSVKVGHLSLADYQGKTIMLTFYNSYQIDQKHEEIELYKEIYKQQINNPNFAMIGVYFNSPYYAPIAAKHLEEQNINWPHGIAEQYESKLAFEYDMKNLPYEVIISTQGKVIAKDLKPDELKEIIDQSLQNN